MKVLASDFDGTLYFRDEQPSIRVRDIEAIKKFQKMGNKYGICTGRHLQGILEPTKDNIHFDFYILNNGSTILDEDLNIVYQRDMDIKDVLAVLNKYSDIESTIITSRFLYAYHFSRNWSSDKIKIINDFKEIEEKNIMSFSFHVDTEEEAKKITHDINLMELPIIAFQNRNDVDCVYRECSKGNALILVQKYFLIDGQDVACIGDSYNDEPMLKVADCSFTFHNSPDSIKKLVKYTVSSISECIDLLLQE